MVTEDRFQQIKEKSAIRERQANGLMSKDRTIAAILLST
jgi:hypothetical protein